VIASHTLAFSTPDSSSPRNLCVSALYSSFSFVFFNVQRSDAHGVYPDRVGASRAQLREVPTFFDVSLFLSHSSALFCVHKKLNSFVFRQFQTLLQKHPGWGTPISIYEDQNETADC
jgi:hypothetical protein